MTIPHARRAALLPIIVCLVGVAAGCPQLNRWSGPSHDPFFSVDDPIPVPAPHLADAAERQATDGAPAVLNVEDDRPAAAGAPQTACRISIAEAGEPLDPARLTQDARN